MFVKKKLLLLATVALMGASCSAKKASVTLKTPTVPGGDASELCSYDKREVGYPDGVCVDRTPFVSKWQISDGEPLILPIRGRASLTVDWGDGTTDSFIDSNNPDVSHVYSNSGSIRTVTILGRAESWGFDENAPSDKLIEIVNFGDLDPTSAVGLFAYSSNLISVNLADSDLSQYDSFLGMFANNFALETVTFPETGDYSELTDTSYMFVANVGLQNVNLSKLDLSNVVNSSGMFQYSNISQIGAEVEELNLPEVKNTSYMFANANLPFDLELINLNPTNAVNLEGMFQGITGNDFLDLTNWNLLDAQNLDYIFYPAIDETSTPVQATGVNSVNLSGWHQGVAGNITGAPSLYVTYDLVNKPVFYCSLDFGVHYEITCIP